MSRPGRGGGLFGVCVWFGVFALGGDADADGNGDINSVLRAVCVRPSSPWTSLQIPQINGVSPVRRAHPYTRHGKLCAIHPTRVLCLSIPPSVSVFEPRRPRMGPGGGDSADGALHRVIDPKRSWESRFGRGVASVGEFWVGGGVCGLGTALDLGSHVVDGGGEGEEVEGRGKGGGREGLDQKIETR